MFFYRIQVWVPAPSWTSTVTAVLGILMLSPGFHEHQDCKWSTNMHAENSTLTHKITANLNHKKYKSFNLKRGNIWEITRSFMERQCNTKINQRGKQFSKETCEIYTWLPILAHNKDLYFTNLCISFIWDWFNSGIATLHIFCNNILLLILSPPHITELTERKALIDSWLEQINMSVCLWGFWWLIWWKSVQSTAGRTIPREII